MSSETPASPPPVRHTSPAWSVPGTAAAGSAAEAAAADVGPSEPAAHAPAASGPPLRGPGPDDDAGGPPPIADAIDGPFPGGGPPHTWPTGRLLSTVARRAERRWDTRLDPHHLSHASLPVLAILSSGPRSQRELAAMLGVTEQTVSRMVVRLEHEGLVVRDVDPADRRRRTVIATGPGRRVLAEVSDTTQLERDLVAPLTADEQATLRALLLRLLDPGPGAS